MRPAAMILHRKTELKNGAAPLKRQVGLGPLSTPHCPQHPARGREPQGHPPPATVERWKFLVPRFWKPGTSFQ